MGFFQWLFGAKVNPRYSQRMNDLDERLDKVERHLRSLDTEWTEYYDKMRHTMGRIVKRAAIIEQSQDPEEEVTETAPGTPSEGLYLSKEQLVWQNRIARERGRSA